MLSSGVRYIRVSNVFQNVELESIFFIPIRISCQNFERYVAVGPDT